MNNKKIYEKTQMKIAISNVKEEDIVMKIKKVSLIKHIIITIGIILSMTGVVFATSQIIHNFGEFISQGVETAIQNGYYLDTNNDYIISNEVGAKIESFLIDEYNFNINISIKFDSNYNLDEMIPKERIEELYYDITDLIVVNEKDEIVFGTTPIFGETFLDEYAYSGSIESSTEKINSNEMIIHFRGTDFEKIPKSKKLLISFSEIKLINKNDDKKSISYNGEWNFEIDVPSSMSDSKVIEYRLVSINDENYKLESAEVSDTGFRIKLYNPIKSTITLHKTDRVETSDGKVYFQQMNGAQEYGDNHYLQTFDLTRYNATDRLKLYLLTHQGDEIIIELEKKI